MRLARPVTGSNIASRWTVEIGVELFEQAVHRTRQLRDVLADLGGISPLRSPCAARVSRAIAASIAAAVPAMLRSAEARHIAPHTTAGIDAREMLAASNPPADVATSARMKAAAPAPIANTIARLVSVTPSIASFGTPSTGPHADRRSASILPSKGQDFRAGRGLRRTM